MAKEFTSLDDIKSAIEGMGFKIGDVWYDGNKSRPVFVCSREGLPHDIEVWAETPKYVNGVTIKDVSARDFDMVDGGEDEAGLKKAIRKALAYMKGKVERSLSKRAESLDEYTESRDWDDEDYMELAVDNIGSLVDKNWTRVEAAIKEKYPDATIVVNNDTEVTDISDSSRRSGINIRVYLKETANLTIPGEYLPDDSDAAVDNMVDTLDSVLGGVEFDTKRVSIRQRGDLVAPEIGYDDIGYDENSVEIPLVLSYLYRIEE